MIPALEGRSGILRAGSDLIKEGDTRQPTPAMENTHSDSSCPTSPAAPPVSEPRTLGGYHVLRRLGEGGMGSVYLGYDPVRHQQVAVKVLSESLANQHAMVDRFTREGKSGALLDHPNIVHSLELGCDRLTGKHFLVLEFVDGPSVQTLLEQKGRLPVGDAVHIVIDMARALEHSHSRNIVHRDIKPANILLTRSGVAKLADLGLAKQTDEVSHLTVTRQGFGTTAYMPYEQAINARFADARSDIYALGVTLYQLVTGRVPFPGDDHLAVIERKRLGIFEPASSVHRDIPTSLDPILARMLARDPRDRYPTAKDLLLDLEQSGLVASLPSYLDPEAAMAAMGTDPAMDNEPTRLALDPPPPAEVDDSWSLRYLNSEGHLCQERVTTAQVIMWMREGSLPAGAMAARSPLDLFRPVSSYAEFLEGRSVGQWHAMLLKAGVVAGALLTLALGFWCWKLFG